jgi:hypothetical protein
LADNLAEGAAGIVSFAVAAESPTDLFFSDAGEVVPW